MNLDIVSHDCHKQVVESLILPSVTADRLHQLSNIAAGNHDLECFMHVASAILRNEVAGDMQNEYIFIELF